jgi:predicted amidohydrolase YtcJ
MKKLIYLFTLITLFFSSCQQEPGPEYADLILTNGNIYTVDESNPAAEAIAVRGDRILKVGSAEEVAALQGDSTEVIDLEGQFLMPGFIEAHGHFAGLGGSLMNLNFLRSKNWDEIVAMVEEKVKESEPGEWIIGRGWHQEKWDQTPERNVLGYPFHNMLSEISPDNPVLLRHASGHGAFANAKAMELAGITAETPNPSGGEIVRDSRGQAIGMFEETAQRLLSGAYSEYRATLSEEDKLKEWYKQIDLAQQECLENGITSFQDAGSSYTTIERYKEMAEKGELDMRLWVMLRHGYDRMKDNMEGFPIIRAGNNFFTCKAIKTALDGALGPFGAWLLESYEDKTDFTGQNTVPMEEVSNIAQLAWDNNMQLCVHAIGDRANRETLNIFEETFQNDPERTDNRWRVEHAQHISTEDIPRFKEMNVIASMQGIHCTSDAPYVIARLGEERAQSGAYVWRSLLDLGVVVANGTDAPVEDVSALESFYASVTRIRRDNGQPFFPEQKMTRAEGIYSYTLASAYAAFEEDIKGSLEEGKLADMVVLSKDLINCNDDEILDTEVLMTFVGGELKYQK